MLFQAYEDCIYVELDYSVGGYLGKDMSKEEAQEVIENYQQYFSEPEKYGFEPTEFS